MKRKEVTRTYYDFQLKEALGLHGLYNNISGIRNNRISPQIVTLMLTLSVLGSSLYVKN